MKRVDKQPLFEWLCPECRSPIQMKRLPTRVGVRSLIPEGIFVPGEPITFLVAMIENNRFRSGVELKCRMVRDFQEPVVFSMMTREAPIEVSTELNEPGFVRLEVTSGELSGVAGAGVDPEKIVANPDIAGFDAFWEDQRQELASVPLRVIKEKPIPVVLPEYSNRGVCFDFRVAWGGGKAVSGMLAKPIGAKARSCPGYVYFHGIGARAAFQPLTWADHGMISINVNAHGLDNDLTDADYLAFSRGLSKDGYKRIVSSPSESVFRDMILGALRAIEYLKSQPEWDGHTLMIHGGSLGALLALAVAALDSDVSFMVANGPVMCDQLGALAGRMPAWPITVALPGMERVAPYFDGVAFARRIVVPIRFTVGFLDELAPPSSVYATYNACASSDKQILDYTDCGHRHELFWAGEEEILEHARCNG